MEKEYRHFIDDVREDLGGNFTTDTLDPQFLDQLNDIIHDEVFDRYSPLKFYWLNLVDTLIYIIQLHEEILNADEYNEGSEELSPAEDELFSHWNESELAKTFLDSLNEGLPVIEASDRLLPLIENQIIAFYVLHINQFQQEFDEALSYSALIELGDFNKRLYLGDQHHYVEAPDIFHAFPSIALHSFKPHKEELKLEEDDRELTLKIKKNAPHVTLGDNKDAEKIYLLPNCEEGLKKVPQFKKNIEQALLRIKLVNPKLFHTFKNFTHSIVPVNEPGIVSYSMQSLPGYSCINMFERDSVDLMDDLLHENGHHYLNVHLNLSELIIEDDEKIYYSPWRKALRPIRGIYHAYLTFFWALELFHALYMDQLKSQPKNTFSKAEKIKIKRRFVEEFFMLEFCTDDLNRAYKSKKINSQGMQLVKEVAQLINAKTNDVEKALAELENESATDFKELMNLVETLNQQRN